MRNKVLFGSMLAFVVLLVAVPMFAHHGVAVYDEQHKIVLKGTLTQFAYVNPHVLLYIDAPDKDGVMRNWVIEDSPPSLVAHSGWTKDMMKAGDQIEMEIAPAKNGAFVGRGGANVTVNGKLLGPPPHGGA